MWTQSSNFYINTSHWIIYSRLIKIPKNHLIKTVIDSTYLSAHQFTKQDITYYIDWFIINLITWKKHNIKRMYKLDLATSLKVKDEMFFQWEINMWQSLMLCCHQRKNFFSWDSIHGKSFRFLPTPLISHIYIH